MTTENVLLNTVQAAKYVGTSRQHIVLLVARGRLRPAQINDRRGSYRFEVSELDRYRRQRDDPNPPDYAPLVTAAQVAERLGVSRDRVWDLVRAGKLAVAVRRPPPMRFDPKEVERVASLRGTEAEMRNAPGLLSTKQVAQRLGISTARVLILVQEDRLVPVKRPSRVYRFSKEEFERFAATRRGTARRRAAD